MSPDNLIGLHERLSEHIVEINQEILFLHLDKDDCQYKLMEVERQMYFESLEDEMF